MAEPQQTFEFTIPNGFSPRQQESIGLEVIDRIRERTQGGVGLDGQLGAYSDSYRSSSDFEAAGKGPQVNLTLTGDMLDSIEVLDVSVEGLIVIGFQPGQHNDKAAWMVEKGYPFLGLARSEIDEIVSGFTPEMLQQAEVTADLTPTFTQSILRGLFGN